MNTDDLIDLFQSLKFWQILVVLGIAAPMASHYGWDISQVYAISLFIGLITLATIVRYFPPPEPKKRPSSPIAVSAAQTAFCSQFLEWTPFLEAAKSKGPEDDKKVADLKEKCRELRLEIGTVQGLLERKVENGDHYVRFYNDSTTYIKE